ncbi:ergosterol biosynthesis ERG4/ERG24 family domain-containing protein [Phthorimaea operculella]|nr:ergosterol biosynthesis ERG4/ERG24 family domain-containing protein [Phthorimaea operculella]
MSTRSGRIRPSVAEVSPPRTRKNASPSRSPGRPRKSSPPAQTSGRKSPSRKSPARKSPSRKSASQFPARKSPSRTTKEVTETAAQKSPGKRPTIKTSDITVKLQDFTKFDSYRTRTRRSEYSIKDLQNELDKQVDKLNGVESSLESNDVYGLRNRKPVEEVPRRSSRLREFVDNVPDIRRSLSKSLSKSVSKSVSQSLDTYSDEENSEDSSIRRKSASASTSRKLHTPLRESVSKLAQASGRWEFGGRIGSAALLLLLPATIFSILISCSKSCTAKALLDPTAYKGWSTWFSWEAVAVILVQNVAQALLSVVPILGTKAERLESTNTKYYFNAFFTTIFTVNILFTLSNFDVFNSNTLLNNYLELAVASYIFAVLLSIYLYVKSRKMDDSELNPYGNTGYKLYDFCLGREIHPYIQNLDVKIWISRVTNINTLVLAVLIFKHGIHLPSNLNNLSTENYQEFLKNVQWKPTILVYTMMQIIYILNFVMKEAKITTTFFWQSEGLGYLQLVASALYPFYFTTLSKHIIDSQISLSTNVLITASTIYLLGFFLMLVSNNIKHEFRKNPLQPNLDSMPTFHGKKLLISNVWGVLRHPNYTGDILVHCALAVPGLVSGHYAAAAPAVLTILVLLHRAARDHARCRRRYGAAWESIMAESRKRINKAQQELLVELLSQNIILARDLGAVGPKGESKSSQIKEQTQGTGGGPAHIRPLTDTEARVLRLLVPPPQPPQRAHSPTAEIEDDLTLPLPMLHPNALYRGQAVHLRPALRWVLARLPRVNPLLRPDRAYLRPRRERQPRPPRAQPAQIVTEAITRNHELFRAALGEAAGTMAAAILQAGADIARAIRSLGAPGEAEYLDDTLDLE